MKITCSKVTRLTVTDIPALDPIGITLENDAPGKGRITIHCGGSTWSSYWPAMGDRSIEQFFINCDNDYLAKNISNWIPQSVIADLETIKTKLRTDIANQSDLEPHEKDELSELVEQVYVDNTECNEIGRKLFASLYGSDWSYTLPKVANPEYLYLCRVINTVKEALLRHIQFNEVGGEA